jgi:ribosomal protein S1
MAVVEKLDKMKTVLQTAKQSLHEADNWTVLASEIEDVIKSSTSFGVILLRKKKVTLFIPQVFESHDIDAIASKVVSMQQSLKVLASSVDYEERRLQLEGFKNKLEAIASPPLVKAFTNNNISKSLFG